MSRRGAWLVLVLTAASGCSNTETLSPLPTKADELLSAARVQDPASVGKMEDALGTGLPDEREVAAFGLGQLGVAWEPVPDGVRERAEAALVAALGSERVALVRDRIIEALGKVGKEAALEALTPLLDGSAPAVERERAAIALALIARSSQGKLVSAAARDAMVGMLKDAEAPVRFSGAYGLLRYRDPETKAAVVESLSDSDPLVRSTVVRVLASLGGPEDVPALSPLVRDADDRVAAEAARTLTRLAMACTTDDCPAFAALLAAPGPLRPAVMQMIIAETWTKERALPFFQARFDEYAGAMSMDPATRALMQCQAALGHDRAAGALDLLTKCGAGVLKDVQRDVLKARALVSVGGAELVALLKNDAAIVRVAAAAGAPVSALPALLVDPDPLVAGAAAARAEELEAAQVGPELVGALIRIQGEGRPADTVEALQSLLSAVSALGVQEAVAPAEKLLDAEPYALRQAAAHALTALTGQPKVARLPLPLGPAEDVRGATVRLSTTRGDIRIRMLVDDAPRTAKNFVDLVGSAFYDGIVVHRVVPDFVTQAGDPRGDGSGGPGYAIPCEINLHRYGEGTVGMALAGRDTGGSQFFIAHSPQPHLDGKYATFGEVIEGVEVAIGLSEGDVILEARVE